MTALGGAPRRVTPREKIRHPPRMAGNNAYEDQIAAYTLANSIVYKVTLTSIDMIKFQ
jgi:hypothetical protein